MEVHELEWIVISAQIPNEEFRGFGRKTKKKFEIIIAV